MNEFKSISELLIQRVTEWEPRLSALSEDRVSNIRNSQNRSIRQILGHMADSASNNIHRVVHLQYQPNPLIFPDYAHFGNNDRWIAIQNYQHEDWQNLIRYWKYTTLHFAHIIQSVKAEKLENEWISATDESVSLRDMITDFPRHFNLHCAEMEELISKA